MRIRSARDRHGPKKEQFGLEFLAVKNISVKPEEILAQKSTPYFDVQSPEVEIEAR
jgi:hypothetical protein